MEPRTIWKTLRSLIVALGVAGCAADPTGPPIPSEASPAFVGDLFEMRVLGRKTALDRDITVAATIGSAGGTISIPKAGLTLVVPRGAVRSKTKFTVTALAGKAVAYEMGPHGMRFDRSLIFRQDLSVTEYNLLMLLKGGYFTDQSLLDQRQLTGLLAEILNGATDPLGRSFTFPIDHFSGYVIAW